MIRLAVESDFSMQIPGETCRRIFALHLAYSIDVPFIHYYADGEGSLLAIMDGVGLFHAANNDVTEEWATFLAMHPDIYRLHCSESVGRALMATGLWTGRVGDVLKYDGKPLDSAPSPICESPSLPMVYALLRDYFEGISPFDAWYPDVSHRVRHGCCHLACVIDGDRVVSTAMTVAETTDMVILGQVATHADHRRKGYAGMCIKSLLYRLQGKHLYILPLNERAKRLYEKIGFHRCDGWAEVVRVEGVQVE